MNQQVGEEAAIVPDRQIKMTSCLCNVRRNSGDLGHIRRVSFAMPQHHKHPRKTHIGDQELQDGVENLVQVQRPGDGRTDLM